MVSDTTSSSKSGSFLWLNVTQFLGALNDNVLKQALVALLFLLWAGLGGWLGNNPGDVGLPFDRVLALGLLFWPLQEKLNVH